MPGVVETGNGPSDYCSPPLANRGFFKSRFAKARKITVADDAPEKPRGGLGEAALARQRGRHLSSDAFVHGHA